MYYNFNEFVNKVNAEKSGQVLIFRRFLTENGLIPNNRAKFTDNDVELFNKAREYKNEQNSTWEQAFKFVIDKKEITKPDLEKSINQVVVSIENLDNLLNKLSDEESEGFYNHLPRGIESISDLAELFNAWNNNLKRAGLIK